MARIVFADAADGDSASILEYLTAQAGPGVAAKYQELFRRLYLRLADHPDLGPTRSRLGRDVRIGIVLPYIVIYRHSARDDTVTILRLVHGRRRISGKLLRGGK